MVEIVEVLALILVAFVDMLLVLVAILVLFELMLVLLVLMLDSTSDISPNVRMPSMSAFDFIFTELSI